MPDAHRLNDAAIKGATASAFSAVEAAAWVIVTATTLGLLAVGSSILKPLAIAIMIVLVINALANGYKRLRLPRWASMAAAIGTIFALLLGMGEIVATNAQQVSSAAPGYEKNLNALLTSTSQQLGLKEVPDLGKFFTEGNVDAGLVAISSALSSFLSNGGLIFLYVAFLLFEQKTFDAKFQAYFRNPSSRAHAKHILGEIAKRIQHYMLMKTLTSLIVGVATFVVVLWVGLNFAPLWALVGFLANFIPVVGGIASLALPVLLALVQFGDLTPALIVLLGCGLAHFINGNIIEPALIGRSMNLSPMVIMIALAVWGLLWGIPGMVLATPITVSLMTLLAAFSTTRPIAILLSEEGRVPVVAPEQGRNHEGTRSTTAAHAK